MGLPNLIQTITESSMLPSRSIRYEIKTNRNFIIQRFSRLLQATFSRSPPVCSSECDKISSLPVFTSTKNLHIKSLTLISSRLYFYVKLKFFSYI